MELRLSHEQIKQTTRQFAAVCVVYDDFRWIPVVLESVYPVIPRIFFFISETPWNGAAADNSKTIQTILEFPDPLSKIEIIKGRWQNETEQRNQALVTLSDRGFEWCFILDADEVYDPNQLQRMIGFTTIDPAVKVWHMHGLTYWKSPEFKIDPPEAFYPPVFVRTRGVRFRQHRSTEPVKAGLIPSEVGVYHHLSYARTDQEVFRKIQTFAHASEVKSSWYTEIWKGWDQNHDLQDLNPCYPGQYKRAIPQPYEQLPPVLQKYMKQLQEVTS